MHYVYLLRSQSSPDQTYIGYTEDLKARLKAHNAGGSPHAANFTPWTLITYIAFNDKAQAQAFETYLKSGSGLAFAKRHFWST